MRSDEGFHHVRSTAAIEREEWWREYLTQAKDEKKSVEDVARETGSTIEAVRYRCKQAEIRLAAEPRPHHWYDIAEYVKRNGITLQQLAKERNLSPWHCKINCQKYGVTFDKDGNWLPYDINKPVPDKYSRPIITVFRTTYRNGKTETNIIYQGGAMRSTYKELTPDVVEFCDKALQHTVYNREGVIEEAYRSWN